MLSLSFLLLIDSVGNEKDRLTVTSKQVTHRNRKILMNPQHVRVKQLLSFSLIHLSWLYGASPLLNYVLILQLECKCY